MPFSLLSLNPAALPDRASSFAPLLVLALLLLVPAGCSEDPAALWIDGVTFTVEEIRGLGETQRMQLARIAAVGIAVRDDEVNALGASILELAREEALIQRLREEVTLEAADVGDDVLRARYEQDPEWELEVRHLVVLSERWRSEAHRNAVRERAASALVRIEAGEGFATVAGEVSDEPGAAERGGLLQPGREGTWVREFWEAALALAPGELSPVVESEFGFHVLHLDHRRPVPFEDARARVASAVALQIGGRATWEEWIEERTAGLEIDPGAITGTADEGAVVARWPGGTLTKGELTRRLPGLPAANVDAFVRGDAEARQQLLEEAALAAILVFEARSRGLEVPEHEEARIERDWERQVASWAAVFGFEAAISPERLREQALRGLTATGQSLDIARGEIARRAPAIEARFTIEHLQEG